MPYRKLPITDATRLNAMQAASDRAEHVAADELAFSLTTKAQLDVLLPRWKTELQERGQALSAQAAAVEAATSQRLRLRMWISHYFQSLFMGVERGVIQASEMAHYQLDISSNVLPKLVSEPQIMLWAERLVAGAAARAAAGGLPVAFPTAAEVELEWEQYKTLRDERNSKQSTYHDEQKDVEALRDQVDALIRDIWDEVEFTYRREQPASLRRKARQYGVYYATMGDASEEVEVEPPPTPTDDASAIG